MGTCNFHAVNASDIFVLLDYFEEAGEKFYNEWAFLKEDIVEATRDRGWSPIKDKSFRFCRSDYDIAVVCKEFWFEYSTSGLKYRVVAYITINPGYYEHSNLDYRLVIDYEDSDTHKDDVVDRLIEDWISPMNCSYLSYVTGGIIKNIWNDGLRKMQEGNFRNEAEKFVEGVVKECEDLCSSLSHNRLRLVGSFSNGEAIYEKIAE